jgi:hypothetical protein
VAASKGPVYVGNDVDNKGSPDPKTVPWADEGDPALGRRAGLIQEARRQSGGLEDESAENPVRETNPFREKR